jgi:hypothetical protein
MFRKIEKLVHLGKCTFGVWDLSENAERIGKGLCDAFAGGQLSLAWRVANPGWGFCSLTSV